MTVDLDACPSAEVLAEWAEGSVEAAVRADLVRHTESCDSCREAIALLAQMRSTPDPSSETGAAAPTSHPRDAARPLPGPGDRIGRFRIEKVLGRGGMGVVLLAKDEHLERDVALKLALNEGSATARLRKEAKALAALRHPNLVAVHEVGEDDGRPFLVMQLVEGKTLRAHVALERPPWRETLAKCMDAARGIEALHAAGFVHRDIKPDNVMLAEDGRVVVVDLGLAQRPEAERAPESARTRTGAIVGTPRYLAPERVAGAPADVASDVYALAATTLELVRASHGPPPERLVATLTRALDPDPKARPSSMAALRDAVDASVAPRTTLWIGGGLAAAAALSLGLLASRDDAPIVEDVAGSTRAAPSAQAPVSTASSGTASSFAPVPSAASMPSAQQGPSASAVPSISTAPIASNEAPTAPSEPPPSQLFASASAPTPSPTPTTSAWISGSSPSSVLSAATSGGWVTVAPGPMPDPFSPAWMKHMNWPARTFASGYSKIMDGYSPCDSKAPLESMPRGLEWGPIEKKEVVQLTKPDGGTHSLLLVMVKGQRGHEAFAGFGDGSYLASSVGDWVLLRPGPASKDTLPAGWEAAKQHRFTPFAPIAGPPKWLDRKPAPKHLPCGPKLASTTDDPWATDRVWKHGDEPFLFTISKPPSKPVGSGPVSVGGFLIEAPATMKNVGLLENATTKLPVWVIGRFVRIDVLEETKLAVMKLEEILPSLVDAPKSE